MIDIIEMIIKLTLAIIIAMVVVGIPYFTILKIFFKQCPYCKNRINKKAIKCSHCHSELRGK
ncbi:hypothetical protein [Psychrilyobacter atlanticus]|uniref:hypothetical protein n=1 Tax=Psychrilyobacter atlanticus TaxID=271091 RepID=UPI0004135215|nr:hypothetical protein [Psychrilyobacter atlanticus]